MIIPRVKSEKVLEGKLCFDDIISVFTDSDDAKKAVRALKYYMPTVTFQNSEDALLVFELDQNLNEEAYKITVGEKIVIKYGDFLGARNACATFSQLVHREGKYDFYINKCEIEDEPKFLWRAFMLDFARGIPNTENLAEDLVRISLMKYNKLHLHMNDSEGFAWQSIKHPTLKGPERNQLSIQFFKTMAGICDTLGLEIIPELDVPGHASAFVEAYPDLHCATSTPDKIPWALCAGNEHFYEILKDLTAELVEMFPNSKYFHIGGDEVEFFDIPDHVCHWDECPRCRRLRKKNKQEVYYYMIERFYNIVKEFGKEVMMWNDWVDISKECPLPKDIIMEYWRVADEQRGPYEGCSMQGFLEQGYKVVNANFWDTYINYAQYATEKGLYDWSPLVRPKTDPQYHDMILGGSCCAWNYGRSDSTYFRYTLAGHVALFTDRLWSATEQEYNDEYKKALTRAILGDRCPEELNIFEYLGGILLPPRTVKLGFVDKITATDEELTQIQLKLMPLSVAKGYGQKMAYYYTECLEWIKDNR